MDINNVFDEKPTIYEKSKKAVRSELNLFELPPTDVTTQTSTEFVECFPLSSVKEDNNPVVFTWNIDGYGSLNDSFLGLGVQIVKSDGTHCETADVVAPTNLFFHALFQNLQLYLNSELVFDASNNYAYSAYLQRLLGTSSLEKNSSLKDEFYYPNKKQNVFEETDSGFKTRYDKTKKSAQFFMIGKLLANFTTQIRYLPPGTEVRIVLRRNVPEFYLDCKTDPSSGGCPYKALITEATFYGAKKIVAPEIVNWHRHQISNNNNFKYPLNEVQIKTFQTPSGLSFTTSDSMLMGKIPKLMVIGMIDSSAYNGKLSKSGFNFEDMGMSELSVKWNGETVENRVFPFSFKGSDTAGVDNFLLGVHSLRKTAGNEILGNGIDLDSYTNGSVLVAVELLPNSGNALSVNRRGSIKIDIKFRKPLEKAITTMVYSQYQAVYEIDKNKRIIFDN